MKVGGCKTPNFQKDCNCRCRSVNLLVPCLFSPNFVSRLYSPISYLINQLIEHKTNKTLKWNVMFHVYHVHEISSTINLYIASSARSQNMSGHIITGQLLGLETWNFQEIHPLGWRFTKIQKYWKRLPWRPENSSL